MEQLLTQLLTWLQGVMSSGGNVTDAATNALAGMNTASLMALAAALGWASGVRLYLVVFLTGAAGYMGWLPLPSGLYVLQHPAMMLASFAMLFVEFFADKIPGLDSVWDVVQSAIRIPAGAALAGATLGADGPTMSAVGALMGGMLATTSMATKATARLAVNSSPEPFSNIALSLFEDGLVLGVMWLATNHPFIFGIALTIIVVLSVLLLWALVRFLKRLFARVKAFFTGQKMPAARSSVS